VSDFEALLKNIGPHKKRYLALNGKTGTCKGFGFVHFKSKEHADKVRDTLNGTNFKDSVLQVDFEAPKPKRPRNFRKRRNFNGADE
jgi:RNA recognition motif-containing protein